jgi:NTE family protein
MIKDLFKISSKPENLGLCLSGGGALGFAHIGVIQSLEDHGIFPSHIAGSSMGAIIGTLYAAGFTPTQMLQMIQEDKLYKITKVMTFHPSFPKSGLSSHKMLRSLIHELIPHNSFEGLNKKMAVCVVNLSNADWEIKSTGNLLDLWLAASSSIPGVFETIKANGQFYVDGGLLNNLPAQGIAPECKTIIGVDVIPQRTPTKLKKPVDTLIYSVRAVQHQNSKSGRDLCQYIIEPDAIDKFHEFNFDAFQSIYQSGYNATSNYILENPEILKLKTQKN